ncbi:hypothetical protein ACH4VT_32875, partial [Streptomyces lydicus]|uniref:hypothetical protein n=1 Tax=Streptomyces lydicus TaxID=47763 RepID=UPI0037B2E4A5
MGTNYPRGCGDDEAGLVGEEHDDRADDADAHADPADHRHPLTEDRGGQHDAEHRDLADQEA